MSTYYKDPNTGEVIFRIAAPRMTFEEDADGSIVEVDLKSSSVPTWTSITGKPTTFAPIIGSGAADAKAGDYVPTWTDIASKPAFIAAGTSAALARSAITAAVSGANNNITSLTGLTTALSVSQGGTGGTSQATAQAALGVPAKPAAVAALGAVSGTAATDIATLYAKVNELLTALKA